MSCRYDRVMNNIKTMNDVIVCRVSEENIYTVLCTECTSIVTNKKNVSQKVILILCNKKVVAVAKIEDVVDYGFNNEEKLWKNNNQAWKTTIKFTDVIMLGSNIDDAFPNTNVKKVETVGYLKDAQIKQLKSEINTLYGLWINETLSSIGI